MRTASLSYKNVGVDIAEIKKSQMTIGKMIGVTHKLQKLARVQHGFGHYAAVVRVAKKVSIATHTDGVGTKVMIANAVKKYDTIGIDCVAMNVNDIICVGATPIAFVDYIAANKNNRKIFGQIMKGLVAGAKKSKMPIVGGETAIMPDLIAGKGFSFDLAGTVTGYIKKDSNHVLGNKIRSGHVIIGAKSTGLHSNGYSLARKALEKYAINDRISGIGHIGAALLKPTQIYTGPVLEAIDRCTISGLAHITGGSFTKLLRLKNIGYEINALPKIPPIMKLIADQGVKDDQMYKTFNMGVGFCVIAPKDQVDKIQSIFKKHGIASQEIGRITTRKGVVVNSQKIA